MVQLPDDGFECLCFCSFPLVGRCNDVVQILLPMSLFIVGEVDTEESGVDDPTQYSFDFAHSSFSQHFPLAEDVISREYFCLIEWSEDAMYGKWNGVDSSCKDCFESH